MVCEAPRPVSTLQRGIDHTVELAGKRCSNAHAAHCAGGLLLAEHADQPLGAALVSGKHQDLRHLHSGGECNSRHSTRGWASIEAGRAHLG